MIDRATIDKIMDATNIVDVVGEFVTLQIEIGRASCRERV